MTARRPYNVLFVCTGNSARSIMAECIINREGMGNFKGFSAGSHPREEVHPMAIDLLKSNNYKVEDLAPKDWESFTKPGAPELDFVFTMCDSAANEVCPVFPGQPISAHWGMPDPASVQGTEAERRFAFADTFRMITQRVGIFVNLPLRSLDRLSLQKRMDEIGRGEGADASAEAP
ncbi:MAG: arsenate reductase ArsC [Alphaproteobacteria bacterium]|nr:arsenate reductase ArsC [Alphaproteobacteria bacterium]